MVARTSLNPRDVLSLAPTNIEDMQTARPVEHIERPLAATVLARAFYDDPVLRFTFPDDATRAARSERSFGAQLRVLQDRREVHADVSFSSVAVWARPNEWEVPARDAMRLLPGFLRNRVGLRTMLAFQRLEALHPAEPHWYLEYLGTEPERQGQGLGGHVLASLLARADADGLPVWAWSSNRENLGFYHRHGFVVLDEVLLAKNGPTVYPIRREAAPT